jgi:hypothetical protein
MIAAEVPMKKAEKLPRGTWRARPGAKRHMKRLVRRQRRRAEDKDPEDVPERFTRGWYW